MIIDKSILYYGQSTWGSTSLQRYNALSHIFHKSYIVDSRRVFPDKNSGRSVFKSIQGRLGYGPIIRLSKNILFEEAARFKPDILWIDGGFLVDNETVNGLKKQGITLIHYTPDSIFAPGMSNMCFRKAIKSYDYLVTTKTQDIEFYNKYDAKKIIFSQQGFDPSIHKKTILNKGDYKKFSSDIVFVGHCMKDRLALMEHLKKELDVNIKIFGTGWDKKNISKEIKECFYGPAIGINYAKAISGSKIALGLLNHEAKDEITTRSFEIPGCGGFLLAERTNQHLAIFKEDHDAAYFSSKDELVEKVKYFLENEHIRNSIKENGYNTLLKGEYTWSSLICNILKEINISD